MPEIIVTQKRSPRFQDLTGQTFGYLTAKECTSPSCAPITKWRCLCRCGKTITASAGDLKSGHTRSCGCYQLEVRTKHGMAGTPEYDAWCEMRSRGSNPVKYKNHAGRGITVCQEWIESFTAFFACVGFRPTPRHSIERIDNNGNYEPGNVKWATPEEQMRNTRRTRMIAFNGETLCVQAWALRLGIARPALVYRLKHWSLERALTEPVNEQYRAWR